MREKSYDCRECYGTVSVLEININSFSSADWSEGTGDFKTLLEFYQ